MEALQWNGLKTVLFLTPPTLGQLAMHADLQAFGIAGTSRSMDNDSLSKELTVVFERLMQSGAEIIHYKTCSTFDSSKEIGNIGLAIEIGRKALDSSPVLVIVGAPHLGRYQVFGNLFAKSGLDSEPYRLDRHPTMSRHPITPMQESDLQMVLANQTTLTSELIDILTLQSSSIEELLQRIGNSKAEIILMDILGTGELKKIGGVIHRLRQQKGRQYLVGSSGVEYALAMAQTFTPWQDKRTATDASMPSFSAVDQLLVVTGSCSPVNDRQIAWAERSGFHSVAIQTDRLVNADDSYAEVTRCVENATNELKRGKNVILHSSRGPNDDRVAKTRSALRRFGLSDLDIRLQSGQLLGPKLGAILKGILTVHPLPRIGIAGGDTSGFIARTLNITALEAIAPVAPGSPLCRVHADNALDGLQIIFKGGQVGSDNVWQTLLKGSSELQSAKYDRIQ